MLKTYNKFNTYQNNNQENLSVLICVVNNKIKHRVVLYFDFKQIDHLTILKQ